jgi:hypothetical protein
MAFRNGVKQYWDELQQEIHQVGTQLELEYWYVILFNPSNRNSLNRLTL